MSDRFQQEIYNEVQKIHETIGLGYNELKDDKATAHFEGRRNSGYRMNRHTVLYRARVLPSYLEDKQNELHLLSYAQNGAVLAADCRSQSSPGTTSEKLTNFILRMLDPVLGMNTKKYLVVDGRELLVFYSGMIERFAMTCYSLSAEARSRLLDHEIRVIDKEGFLTNYKDFAVQNQMP